MIILYVWVCRGGCPHDASMTRDGIYKYRSIIPLCRGPCRRWWLGGLVAVQVCFAGVEPIDAVVSRCVACSTLAAPTPRHHDAPTTTTGITTKGLRGQRNCVRPRLGLPANSMLKNGKLNLQG